MEVFTFKAIGTEWSVSVDGKELDSSTKNDIQTQVEKFEKQFSRFLDGSEVNSFRTAATGLYPISKEFYKLLKRADLLRHFTGGVFDPAVGEFLERTGYNPDLTFETSDDIDEFVLPNWSLESDSLKLEGPTAFDLGGIGKGYAIDMVSKIVNTHGYKYYIVEAGGDMFGTIKADGSHWNIAIQFPGKTDEAVGTAQLSHNAIAVSDTFRRRWGRWNHVVNPQKRASIENVIGAVAVASSAWDADCMTSVLFLGREKMFNEAAKEWGTSFLLFYRDLSCLKSLNWKGEVFT